MIRRGGELVPALHRAQRRRRRDAAPRTSAVRARARSMFLFRVLLVFALYTLTLGLLPVLGSRLPRVLGTAVVSVPLQIVFAVAAIGFVRESGYPAERFGITWRGAGRAIGRAILFTLPMVLAAVACKWLALRAGILAPAPLFDTAAVVTRLGGPVVYAAAIAIYALFSAVQELVARGVVQTGLEMFLHGPHRAAAAIVLSNVVFAVTHVHISPALVAGSFVVGMFWGIVFYRERSLPAVTASHLLLGLFVYFLLGVEPSGR